jgi:hypothetical protein
MKKLRNGQHRIKSKLRDSIFLIIRVLLLASIVINAVLFIRNILPGKNGKAPDDEIAKNLQMMIYALIAFILSFGTEVIENTQKVLIPDLLEVAIVIFIYAAIVISAQFNLYYTVFWWDDLLHFASGIIIGFVGFLLVDRINKRYDMHMVAGMAAVFAFTFALSMGCFWEFGEFTCDALFGSALQKWDLDKLGLAGHLLGRSYQGSGLRDTMSDLMLDAVGAFITSMSGYIMIHKRTKSGKQQMGKKKNEELKTKKEERSAHAA